MTNDIATALDGDLNPRPTFRKVDYVADCLVSGRTHSLTYHEYLSGPDRQEVRWGVWRRARRNARLALALPDEWKREAEAFGKARRTSPVDPG